MQDGAVAADPVLVPLAIGGVVVVDAQPALARGGAPGRRPGGHRFVGAAEEGGAAGDGGASSRGSDKALPSKTGWGDVNLGEFPRKRPTRRGE